MSNAKQQEQPEYIRAKQVARMIGVSPATFFNYKRRPELEFPPGIRMGGAVVYPVTDIRAWMRKRAALTAQPTKAAA